MKKSEVIELIRNSVDKATQGDIEITPKEALVILKALEKEGLLAPRHLTLKEHGHYRINYGWEPE